MQYKKIIVWIILISCLVAWAMDLINIKPWQALWAMLVLYFIIPLVSLSLIDSHKWYVKIWWIIATILLLAISRFHVYPLIGAAIFVWWSILSLLRHNTLLQRRKQITPWWLAIVHSATFCMTCAIAWSFSIMGKWKGIDVNCDEVRGFINQHMAVVLAPIWITTWQMDNIQLRVDWFFTKSTDEVIQEQVTNQISTQLGWIASGNDATALVRQQLGGTSIADIAALLKNSPQWWQVSDDMAAQIATMLKSNANVLTIKTPDPSTLASNNPFAKRLQERAKNKLLISGTVGDKQELDNKICNVVFDQIKTRSTLPWFTLSILISLIFFFYPLIRLFTYFYAGFISLVYMLLRKMWFISVVPEEKIVDTRVVWNGYTWNTILSTLAVKSKIASQIAKKQSPAQIAQNATPPMQPTKSTWPNNIDAVFEWFDLQWWGSWWNNPNHIITANSRQDKDTINLPPSSKQDIAPRINFGNFGWNFDKPPQRKNNLD